MFRCPLLFALLALPAGAATFRTNPGPNEFRGPTIFQEFVAADREHLEEGILRRTVWFGSNGINRRKEVRYTEWKIDKDGDWTTLFHYNHSGRLLTSETWRSNEEILRAGWDLRTTVFNASGYADRADFRYIPERSKREHLRSLREHYDPEGRIRSMTRYFTPEYTVHTGDIREIRTFDVQGLAQLLTVASNRTLAKKGILLMTESRVPVKASGGECLWREFIYSETRAESTGFRSVKRFFGLNGRPMKDEIGFHEEFEAKNGVVRGLLEYDNFEQPVKLTCFDRRHKVKKEVFGKTDISKFLGRRFPSRL